MKVLDENIAFLPGVGQKRLYLFNKLGLFSKRDLLFYLPFQYLSLLDKLEEGYVAIKVKFLKKFKCSSKFCKVIVLFEEIEINLYFYNVKFFNIFYKDRTYYLCGNLYVENGQYCMNSPNILNSPSKIIPIYKGISSYLFSSLVLPLINELDNTENIWENYTLKKIFFNLHMGLDVQKSLQALKYLEASFLINLFSKEEEKNLLNVSLESVLKNFPYVLSKFQLNICKKIEKYLNGLKTLKYFVYGEVGAGKTIISIVAMLLIIQAGYNVILLAPTVALAYQHYSEILKIIPSLTEEILLLTGLSKKKKQIKENIAKGAYKIIVGTHALMYLKEIANLGLIIIDEIHKFGVLQRSKLLDHAIKKNVLMLTATPIPRSLSMIISKLMHYDTLPSFNKKQVKTLWVKIENMYELLNNFQNKKIYWVMPNIEENEKNSGIKIRFQELSTKSDQVFMLHGKMKDNEKLQVIEQFKKVKSGILVATTIIEIGINIPDADIIVIENAENFGLSQLHQLRGRVGRMGQESFCILLSKFKNKKIQYMKDYDNGFDISQKDLELRGGGKITGFLQHGSNSFYFLTEVDDDIMEQANKDKKKFKAFDIFSSTDISC